MLNKINARVEEVKFARREGDIKGAFTTLLRRIRGDLYGVPRNLYARMTARNGVAVLRVQGSLMALRLDDPGLSKSLIRNGVREVEHTQLIHEELRPGMTCVDLGANLGYYALIEAKLVGPSGKVFAIEPVPQNVGMLRRSVELNSYKNIEVHQMAISDEGGESDMWITAESNLGNLLSETDNSLTDEFRKKRSGGGQGSIGQIKVPTMTLDDFLESRGVTNVNFIRMDIEGYELRVIKGMQRTLRSTQQMKMLVEVHNRHFAEPEKTVGPWIRSLMELGFQPKALALPSTNEGILRDLPILGFPEFLCSFREHCPHLLLVREAHGSP